MRLSWNWPARADLQASTLALLVAVAWDLAGADLAVSRLFADAQGFAWRDAPLLALWLHQVPRVLTWVLALGLAASLLRPRWLGLTRGERAWCVLAAALAAAAIPLVKASSATSCPWDLAEFGGAARHIAHWHWGQRDGGGGRCFPSGHASTAFAWFGAAIAWRGARPLWARRWTLVVLACGLALGAVQVMRGAHYVSHVLWALWLCHAVTLLLAPLLPAASQSSAVGRAVAAAAGRLDHEDVAWRHLGRADMRQ